MRFFFLAEPPTETTGRWNPPANLRQHLRALRFGDEENFLLLPPEGPALEARLLEKGDLELLGTTQRPRLPLLPTTLATAWPKGARADELVRRATESGVQRILPLRTSRSVAGKDAFSPSKRARWQRIMEEVASQCRRPELPTLLEEPLAVDELPATMAARAPAAKGYVLTPGTLPLQLSLELNAPRELWLAVGPEGGFSPEEEELLEIGGFLAAGLAPTVLRIEAAGPLAVALCQHHYLCRQGH
jgi:16S rRNA (uracil1498-N3)-methyltransferase